MDFRRKRTMSEASYRANNKGTLSSLQGPIRVIRLCILSIIIPGALVGLPLYMRYYVYGEQVYPVGMSDMRLLDNRVSTTWCQSQTIWSNATFNAYLMAEQPQLELGHEHVSMTRHLKLDDDMKEYWGFYLLRGSIISVSTCTRWPGASLILIKGHKHLRDCAYIGDDSSEELDELDEDESNSTKVHQDPANDPTKMTKLKDGIVHHQTATNHTAETFAIHHKKKGHSSESDSISKDEKVRRLRTDRKLGPTVHLAFAELGNKLVLPPYRKLYENGAENMNSHTKANSVNKKFSTIKTLEKSAEPSPKKAITSREIYEDVMKKLESLNDNRAKMILERLNSRLSSKTETSNVADKESSSSTPENNVKIRHHRKLFNKIEEQKINKSESENLLRKKREVILGTLEGPLTTHNEEDDAAMEEDIHQPDEIAEIRGTINETDAFDKSNSEFWSSFSSSEERLMNCEGLLLNLPLMPHHKCEAHQSEHALSSASSMNKITYRVTSNGYYFFVFNSENEVQTNYLRVHFDLEKTKYNVSQPIDSCQNQTSSCNLPLRFFSHQKVVLHLPIRKNDTLWNQEFLAISTCEPRTSVYIICVLSVPLFILLFAFQ